MRLTSVIINLAAPAPVIEDHENFLFIGPHPDDLEIGAGATIARLCAEGKKVTFLICMDGRFGLEHAPAGMTPDQLAKLREKETIHGARVLGVSDVRFLELSDGGLYDKSDLTRGIAKAIGDVQPDILFAPDPCVFSECHVDHLNVGEAVRRLAFLAPFEEIMKEYGAKSAPVQTLAYYMTARPNRFIKTAGFRKQQMRALLCHKSQFPKTSEELKQIGLYLKIRETAFGIRSLKGKAEGFRTLGRTQMHCLPEASE